MGPEKRLEALGRPREDQWLERKSLRVAPEVLARSIVGFANAEGGLIVLGLSDGVVEDASHYASRVNAVRRVPHTHCAPPPRARFHEVEVPGGTLLVIDVPPGDTLHETTNGECYLRVGDSITKLTATQREELAYDRGAAQFEARAVADVTVADLDSGLLAQLRTGMGSGLEDTKMLAARSLLTPSGGVTVAAYLLFHEHPQELMPHAHIRVLRHLSSEAGTGSRQSVMEGGDVRIEGAIEPSLRQATALLDEWVPKRQALRDDGRFGPVPVVPRDAWLEGLVNAVVHRSYSMAGDHIRVAVFPDRVEIESPGRFPGVVDPSRPLEIARYARNPRIARVCNDLGITQERGEGIRRIVDEMRLSGLEDPVYRQTSGSVRLTLFGNTRLSEKVAASLPTGAQDVLRILRSVRQPMGTGEIADAVGLARPATIRALKALQQINEVQWRGTSKQDPRATWSLPEL
ncbi:MAG: ATP-binding protein [Propionibacteriaceae bacterium]|nr:ATP-binding protein [Propionibacteriaceae bacterium]